jgi:lysozyme
MSNAAELSKVSLKLDEGLRLRMYKCPAGFNTVGYGFNLDANRITQDIADALLEIKVKETEGACADYEYWPALSDERKAVLINLCYCVGSVGFSNFNRMQEALMRGEYTQAAVEILDSAFADQTGDRAKRLALTMRDGS